VVVVQLKNLDDLGVVVFAELGEETLGAAEESLLVTLRVANDLGQCVSHGLSRLVGFRGINLRSSGKQHAWGSEL
jgi:hypothetical protein